MATRQGSQINTEDGRANYNWSGLLNGDIGTAVGSQKDVAEYTVQAAGTFGAAGSVALLGSNDGTTFFAMEDVSGTTIAMTTSKIWRVTHMPKQVKPSVTAGDGTTSLAVNISGVMR